MSLGTAASLSVPGRQPWPLQDHLRSGHTMEQQTSESLLPRCPRPAT